MPMDNGEIERLIDRVGVLRKPCDLDLMVFLARHPRAILTSEQLAKWLGYEIKQVADSLDALIDAGLLERTQTRRHAARLYVLTAGGQDDGWLSGLVRLLSTRPGRLAALTLLAERNGHGGDGSRKTVRPSQNSGA